MALQSNQLDHDEHSFGVNSKESAFVLYNDSGWLPKRYENYVVHNIGRSEIQAELWYGDEVRWYGVAQATTLSPNQKKILDNAGYLYYYLGLKIINNGEQRAIVVGEKGDVWTPYKPNTWMVDFFNTLAETFVLCVRYFGNIRLSNFFKDLFRIFWPENKPNVWEEISEKVHRLLDENTQSIIKALLENEIAVYQEKIKSLQFEFENKINIREHYMAIAYDLIGLEQKFFFSDTIKNHENINLLLLPMFSCIVSMKIYFYLLGIRCAKDIGLSKDNVLQIEQYSSKTFQNASKHIKNLLRNAVENTYKTCDSQTIFNNMMITRSHLALHGEETLSIWENYTKNPSSDEEVYSPVISYSRFFGKPTPNLYRQATAVDVPPPSCPTVTNGKRNLLKEIQIYLVRSKIGGARLVFKNGEEYTMGTITSDCRTLLLNELKILKITAFGERKIDGLKFELSDGNIHLFGQTKSCCNEEFYLRDHHIASFYLSSDSDDLGGQAANIAVAFQQYKKNQEKPAGIGNFLSNFFRRMLMF